MAKQDRTKNGLTIWFTGMSGAGKSTLSASLATVLLERGCKVEVLDGDEVRTNLSKELGFSKEDRDTNLRRIGYVCRLLSRNGVIAISAAISPYREVRRELRDWIDDFVEVWAKCDLESLTERDPKGLYKRALAGEIENFTGVSDPYEEPEHAEIVVDTAVETVEESLGNIVRGLEELGYIPTAEADEEVASAQEQTVRQRLRDLGYI